MGRLPDFNDFLISKIMLDRFMGIQIQFFLGRFELVQDLLAGADNSKHCVEF